MFKKTKNSLAITLSAAMMATMITVPQVASAATGTQISGVDRYQTALKIVEDGWKTSESAVIARGDDLADALAAAPLAYAKGKAPILLTKTTEIPAGVLKELKDLGVKNVYIVGGVGAVSKTVADQLAAQGLTITRVEGKDRYETSLAVAKQAFGAAPAEVVIANGLAYADALSVSSIAASKGMPILLVDHNKLSAEQSTYIAGKSVYAVGGEGVLNADVVSTSKAVRLAGADRYATNAAVLAKFDFDYTKLYLAKGTPANLVDSLAGSALASLTNSPIVLVDGQSKVSPELTKVVIDKIKDNTSIIRLGGTVAQSAANDVEAMKTAVNVGALKVESTSAISANQIQVAFNKVPSDASKVTFKVEQSGNAVEVATGWDTTGTKATLTKTAKFTEGTYTVKVMDGTTELGTSNVIITEQKVAKINITSTKLGVTGNGNDQRGYATYNIKDQYGVDITTGALANNVQFQTGVGSVDSRKGLLTITPASGLNLMTFNAGVTITANDTSTGVAGTATLAVTSQLGTLSDIKLTELTNKDKKVLTAGSTTDIFYAGFTATDISGNPTSDYTLMKQGLIFTGNGSEYNITTSSPYVTAKLVQDPKDSNKGVIEVRSTIDTISVDMPLIITAMTWTGSTSQITTTLKKQAEVDKFTVMAPNDSIASGESKEIPFLAVDQNGVKLTKFSDFPSDLVTFNNLIKSRNSDGTLSLKNKRVTNTGTSSVPEVLSAMTKSGKYSSVTINIQKPTEADTLSLDADALKTVMQESKDGQTPAVQNADFGWDDGGLTVKDQYDRAIDINATENSEIYKNYRVNAKSDNEAVIKITKDGYASAGEKEIGIQSGITGSATVTFELVDTTKVDKTTNKPVVIDSRTQTFTVLKDDDIKDYTMDTMADPIYVSNNIDALVANSAQAKDYDFNPEVFGTTSTGAKVVLRGTPIIGASSTSSDFKVFTGNGETDSIELIANKLADQSKTSASTILSITLLGADGIVHSVTTPVTSSTVDPLAKSMDVSVATEVDGISRLDDVVTLDNSALLGNTLAKFNADGSKRAKKNIYFAPIDQYGSKAWKLSQFVVVNTNKDKVLTTNLHGHAFSVDAKTGVMTGVENLQVGDWFTVSGTTTNGIVKTIRIDIGVNNTSVTPTTVDKTALGNSITAAKAKVEATYTAASWTAMQTALTAANTENASTTATTATVATAKSNLDAAVTALVKNPLAANEVAGTITTDIFGNKVVTATVVAGTISKVTVNDAVKVLDEDYSVTGSVVKEFVTTGTETVKITVDAVEYTVVYK